MSHDEQRLFSDLLLESHVVAIEEENKVTEGGTEITKHPSHSCKVIQLISQKFKG